MATRQSLLAFGGASMEPEAEPDEFRASALISSYHRLRHNIDALLAENRELTRLVHQLRARRYGRLERLPATAPPILNAPQQGHFPFPNPGG